jgi:hypothetical protein
MAAQLGYQGPKDRMNKAIENTRQMFDIITGLEHAAKKNKS